MLRLLAKLGTRLMIDHIQLDLSSWKNLARRFFAQIATESAIVELLTKNAQSALAKTIRSQSLLLIRLAIHLKMRKSTSLVITICLAGQTATESSGEE